MKMLERMLLIVIHFLGLIITDWMSQGLKINKSNIVYHRLNASYVYIRVVVNRRVMFVYSFFF